MQELFLKTFTFFEKKSFFFRYCSLGVGLFRSDSEDQRGTRGIKYKGKKNGASDRNRTGDNHVGNVMLYQLSYTRI